MIVTKGQLGKKEQGIVSSILEEFTDDYSDFYITKNNLRLFLRENKDILFECLKDGDKITYSEEHGMIFLYGYSDKAHRHYIKILSKDSNSADKLIKVTLWNYGGIDLYAKIKTNNPLTEILKKNNFRYLGNRGKEILLMRKGIKIEKKEKSYVR